ncbi:hypothetical protein B0H10DRAFT_1946243 [Mycena sp. CBHHK59/15]|nr:hypothetical protein B0H10DRAFT_1946243 [Mycena sp. CBHHK59/15]
MAATPALATLTAEPDWNLILAPLFTPRDLETPQIQCQLVFSLLTFLTLSIRDFLFFLFKSPIPMVKQRVGIFMGNHPTLDAYSEPGTTAFPKASPNFVYIKVKFEAFSLLQRLDTEQVVRGWGFVLPRSCRTRCRVPLGTTGSVWRTTHFGLAYGLVLERTRNSTEFNVSSQDIYY